MIFKHAMCYYVVMVSYLTIFESHYTLTRKEEACSMAVPAMNTQPKTIALQLPSTHPDIRNANHR